MAHSVYKYRKGEAYPHCYKYPQAAVTADWVLFSYDCKKLKVLLIKRGGEPFKGFWAFPGGFINPDETVEQGAQRELMEETSLKADYMEQLKVFSTPDRDPRQRVITVPFLGLVRYSEAKSGDDAAEAAWFDIDQLPVLAFDHKQIFHEAMKALKISLEMNGAARFLMPDQFTMPELYRLYSQILGVKLDRRNFARKMSSLGVLDFRGTKDSYATERSKDLPSRTPSLFSFRNLPTEQSL